MIKTSHLIEALAADARPVRRLRPPVLRAALWLLLAALIFGLLAVGHGVRPDLAQRLEQPDFIVGTAAALLTGVLAAVASFMLNLPDRSRGWALLPVPALLVWMATLGYGCLVNWVSIGPYGVQVGETARCFATVLMTSLPLSLAMLAMLRHGAVLSASTVSLTGSLAVAAITATAMSIFHSLDASVMILVWNLGTAVLIVALGRWLGPRLAAAGR
ncbi:NrsF family protein [Variovorax sp. LjRoot178]|uniref:NrsF family protein n=1 Tax=Variovorax sp. LjRoot178 TaxID=3342277 RepID=UPI003ED145CC